MKSKIDSYQFTWFDRFCLWYPPGWLILFNRHWQHYHEDADGWNGLEYLLFLIPGGFYLALLLRWLRLGCRSPRGEECKFDFNYQKAFLDEVITPILKQYFRGSLQQIENLPEKGPLVIAMNHAGMSFPWDFMGLACLLRQQRSWQVRSLAGLPLFEHPWVKWWLPPGWSQVLGGVRAQLDDFEAVVAQNTILLYSPEGLRGPEKAWGKRYQLQTFHPSFIQLSDRYNIPILPVVCIGNESLHPWTVNIKQWADKLSLPFFPISWLMLAFIFFPSMGVWANRSSLQYYIQTLYQPSLEEKLTQQNYSPREGRSLAYRRAQLLRIKMQSEVDRLLRERSSTNLR